MARDRVLITGISGFIAKHTALQFLEAGYAVRGTVRDAKKGDEVARTLAKYTDISKLEFTGADLLSDTGWDSAMDGCDCVAHMASPFPLVQPRDENELIRPAVEGTLRVLKAAADAGVERFVQTSSSVAVIYGHPRSKTRFDETDWTNVQSPDVTPYQKSKTLAEKAARDFVAEHAGNMHYASVNPGLVLGPPLDSRFGSSLEVIRMLLAGKYPGAPKLKVQVVDVRDIARMHLLAMETSQPSGGRYLGIADSIWMIDMANMLREGLAEKARKAPKRELPDFVVRLVALFDGAARSVLPELDWDKTVDNSHTRSELAIGFIPADEAVVTAGKALIDMKVV
jgi:dihydroflavonol-4-reductase